MAITEETPVLDRSYIVVGCKTVDRDSAIKAAADMLVERGLVDDTYGTAMLQREETVSTYMGNGVALPHGTFEAKDAVLGTGIVVLQYPDGVEWPNGTARLVVGLAAKGEAHVEVLSQLAEVLQDEDLCERLAQTDDAGVIYEALTATGDS